MGVLFWKEPKALLRLTGISYKSGQCCRACWRNLQPNGPLTANVATLIGGLPALLADPLNATCVDFSVKALKGISKFKGFASVAQAMLCKAAFELWHFYNSTERHQEIHVGFSFIS